MLMCREDVAKIGAVEDVLEGREDTDEDGRAVFGWNVSAEGGSVCLRSE